jgi:hypothetical protein
MELRTSETEAIEEDGEGADPMGPEFRAAEQPFETEFQVFPVSVGARKGLLWGPHEDTFSL